MYFLLLTTLEFCLENVALCSKLKTFFDFHFKNEEEEDEWGVGGGGRKTGIGPVGETEGKGERIMIKKVGLTGRKSSLNVKMRLELK